MMEELVSLPLKMQLMTGVISQSWNQRNVAQHCAIGWKEMLNNTRGYWIERLLRDPNEGVAYFKRFLRPHFIKGAQNVFLYRFMQFMKFNRGTMDLQKWMTRFQLTGNRLIESWMDLLPEVTVTSPEAILFVQQRRQEHERDQQETS